MVTAGEILKNKREALGKSIATVSSDTKIQKRFVEYIENDEYDKFDSDVFASGFIKIYSQYLGLDVDKLLALYRRSNLKENTKNSQKVEKIVKRRNLNIHITPQTLAIIILSIFFVCVIGYVGYQIYKFQKPPELTILQPEDEYKTKEDKVLVKGNTDSSSTVIVNGDQIDVDSLGYFEKEIKLNAGVNTITVISKKNSSNNLETSKVIKVIYDTQQEQTETPQQNIPQEYKLNIKIIQSASWIKLDVDGENKISAIVQPDTSQEFTFTNGFSLTTGKIPSTMIEVNGEPIQITSKQNTGVGQVTCTISSQKLECI